MQDAVVVNRAAIAGIVLLGLVAYGFLAFNLTLAGDDFLRSISPDHDVVDPPDRCCAPLGSRVEVTKGQQ
jgi:hypothetical protein